MGECSRCGVCCQYLPRYIKGMSFEYLNYLIQHGITIEGDWALIPHDCQHLKYEIPDREDISKDIWTCDIHDKPERSSLCRKFHGQKRGKKGTLFWVPERCTMGE
jgi:hypothetical protein